MRTLGDVIAGADVFLGLSAGSVLKPEMVAAHERAPADFRARESDAGDSARGRKGRATATRSSPRVAATTRIRSTTCCASPTFFAARSMWARRRSRARWRSRRCARLRISRDRNRATSSASAYDIEELSFGPEYLIPKPFDPRLIVQIAPAVARAAMEAGVATRPIADFDAYRQQLQRFVYHSGTFMKPVFAAARKVPAERSRIIFAEGEEERVLRAAQILIDEGIARPILVGRPAVIESRLKRYGLRLQTRRGFPHRQSRARRALRRVLAGVSPPHGASRR